MVRHIIIDRSVKIIPARAFQYRFQLLSVEMHEDVEKIEEFGFDNCHSLTGIKLLGVLRSFLATGSVRWNLVISWKSLGEMHFLAAL